MTTIIALVVAAILDKYALKLPGAPFVERCRSSAWLHTYLSKCLTLMQKIGVQQSYLIVLATFIPLCILLFITKLVLGAFLGSLGVLLFLAVTLFYFLGNRNVGADQYVGAHETSYGVLFWFALLGPTGALLYWFLVAAEQTPIVTDGNHVDLRTAVGRVHALAAWVPARITGFIYALVGNFTPGFSCWMACMQNPAQQSSQVLQECGRAAVDASIAGDDARLVQRSFIAWVVLAVVMVEFVRL